jgi:hypothetical protein
MRRPALSRPAALALALAAAAACNTGFEPQYRVKDLRVLAVRSRAAGSTAADVGPGDTLLLDALFANPRRRAGLTVTWYGCLPVASERLPPCARPEYLADPSRLAAAAADAASGVLLLGACQPSAPPDDDGCGIAVPVPPAEDLGPALDFVVDLALSNPAFSCRLYAEVPVVAVVEAEGRRAVALKTVRIAIPESRLPASLRDVYVVNTNPSAGAIVRAPTAAEGCGGGVEVDGVQPFPAGETVLCASVAGEAPQEFQTCNDRGREIVVEEFEWQWYVATSGEFPDEDGGVGNATGQRTDFVRPAGAFRLWAILRDERGGTDWLRADVGAVAP